MIVKNPKDKSLSVFVQGVKELGEQSIEVGHFESQGNHSDSELSYVDLLTLYAFGAIPDQPKRDVRAQFVLNEFQSGRITRDPTINKVMQDWYRNLGNTQEETELLETIGMVLRRQYKKTFGVVTPLMPTDSTNSPLLESGELQQTAAYTTSKNSKPKEQRGRDDFFL